MRRLLQPHPDSCPLPAVQIEVDVACSRSGVLALSYSVTGKLGDVLMPAVTTAVHADELWQHSCFEAFVRASAANEYYEFNFSPSTKWAAYRFNGYRSGMRPATDISPPTIKILSSPDQFILHASIELDRLTDLQTPALLRLGLSVVIEDRTGRKSYWALAHPPGKPDFHHPDCFTQEIPPTFQT